MQQTKLGSLYESIMNIVVGAVVAFTSQILIFPMYGIEVSLNTNIGILVWFTLISVVRSYVIRRWFNAKLHKAAMKLADL